MVSSPENKGRIMKTAVIVTHRIDKQIETVIEENLA